MNTNKIKFATNLEQLQAGTESVFSIAPKVPAKGSLVIYENSIKFYHPDQKIPHTEPPERIENDIKNFSASSRKRLFDLFNQINYSSYGIPLFLSLTYHYDDPTNRKSLKEMLRSFHKRLNRALPPFHYIWKFEYPGSLDGCKRITEIINGKPWVLLSAGLQYDKYREALKNSMLAGASGFAGAGVGVTQREASGEIQP